jgi:hypothetical protein
MDVLVLLAGGADTPAAGREAIRYGARAIPLRDSHQMDSWMSSCCCPLTGGVHTWELSRHWPGAVPCNPQALHYLHDRDARVSTLIDRDANENVRQVCGVVSYLERTFSKQIRYTRNSNYTS